MSDILEATVLINRKVESLVEQFKKSARRAHDSYLESARILNKPKEDILEFEAYSAIMELLIKGIIISGGLDALGIDSTSVSTLFEKISAPDDIKSNVVAFRNNKDSDDSNNVH